MQLPYSEKTHLKIVDRSKLFPVASIAVICCKLLPGMHASMQVKGVGKAGVPDMKKHPSFSLPVSASLAAPKKFIDVAKKASKRCYTRASSCRL